MPTARIDGMRRDARLAVVFMNDRFPVPPGQAKPQAFDSRVVRQLNNAYIPLVLLFGRVMKDTETMFVCCIYRDMTTRHTAFPAIRLTIEPPESPPPCHAPGGGARQREGAAKNGRNAGTVTTAGPGFRRPA